MIVVDSLSEKKIYAYDVKFYYEFFLSVSVCVHTEYTYFTVCDLCIYVLLYVAFMYQ